jgi:phosphate transport system substrate-binding protein
MITKKKIKNNIYLPLGLILITIFILSIIFSGCKTSPVTSDLSGVKFTNEKLTINGGVALLDLSQTWAKAFSNNFGGFVTINGGGSGTGISDLINGKVDLATSPRRITDKEIAGAKASGTDIKEYKVAIDSIVVIVSKNIKVYELAIYQLSNIYTGKYTNWDKVNGPNIPIIVTRRDASSPTGEFFLLKVVQQGGKVPNNYNSKDLKFNSDADVASQVETKNSGIGYVSIGYLNNISKNVNIVKVMLNDKTSSVAPTVENISNLSYPISRYFFIYANGKKTSKIAQSFIDFVLSTEGQNIVAQSGFIKIK